MQKFVIVTSRFNEIITQNLLKGCKRTFSEEGIKEDQLETIWVPGAFELPLTAKVLAETNKYDAIVCLGAVLRGETPHFDYICAEVATGTREVSLQYGLPVIFGVLTTDTVDQAMERSGQHLGNKGSDSAMVALEMVAVLKDIREGSF